jgi:protein-S-isoprenylcysteine O-methyltransferase Ste14
VPLSLKIVGFSGFAPAFFLVFWTMTENTYLSEIVRIQKERGHRVCTTGPYKYVRHPMYAGVILIILCLPLALGSFYSLIPGSLIILLFILRTFLEDKTLQDELPGYRDYAGRVRYKLIPGIW